MMMMMMITTTTMMMMMMFRLSKAIIRKQKDKTLQLQSCS